MKSRVIRVRSTGEGMDEALRQAELAAEAYDLPHKDALHLRLLGEEMMGMLRAVTGEMYSDFWVEEDKGTFSLHLSTDTQMYLDKREELLALSSTGKNAAAKGFMGKIRSVIDAFATPEVQGVPSFLSLGLTSAGADGAFLLYDAAADWSLNAYRAGLESRQDSSETAEAWDELEKSVVAKLADDVSVAIRGNNVELIIYKTF